MATKRRTAALEGGLHVRAHGRVRADTGDVTIRVVGDPGAPAVHGADRQATGKRQGASRGPERSDRSAGAVVAVGPGAEGQRKVSPISRSRRGRCLAWRRCLRRRCGRRRGGLGHAGDRRRQRNQDPKFARQFHPALRICLALNSTCRVSIQAPIGMAAGNRVRQPRQAPEEQGFERTEARSSTHPSPENSCCHANANDYQRSARANDLQ